MGRGGRRELSRGLESWVRITGSESQIGSSHEDDVTVGPVMSHGGSSHESRWVPSRTVGLVGGSSRWVQSVGPVTRSRS
jgi:hypothetical protein